MARRRPPGGRRRAGRGPGRRGGRGRRARRSPSTGASAPEAGSWGLAFARRWARATPGSRLQPGRHGRGVAAPGRRSTRAGWSSAWPSGAPRHASPATTPATSPPSPRSTGWPTAATRTVRVAVADEESPPELVAAADVVVHGPAEALDLLRRLADARRGADVAGADLSGAQSPPARGDGRELVVEPGARRRPGHQRRAAPRPAACAPAPPCPGRRPERRGRARHVEGVDLERLGGAAPRRRPPRATSARTPSVVLTSGPSLATRLSPSRNGFTSRTS